MRLLAFVDEDRHFDGHCVRFQGKDGAASICCAITAAALKEQDRHLPRHGLVPAEMFLEAFDRQCREIESKLRELPGVTNLLTTIGETSTRVSRGSGDVTRGSVLVRLVDLTRLAPVIPRGRGW